MTSRDFAYWLQGFLELRKADSGRPIGLQETQVDCIEKHLALVFKHEIDPSMGPPKHQDELNKVHNSESGGGTTTTPSKFNPHPGGPTMRC